AGANTYNGNTTINGGVLRVGAGGTTGTLGAGPVFNSGTLVFDRSDVAPAIANSIGGTGSVVQAGAGTTILSSANSYQGGTTVNAGVLQGANGTSGSATGSSAVTLNGGVLSAGAAGGSISGLVSAGSGAHIIAPSSGLSPGTFATLNLNG